MTRLHLTFAGHNSTLWLGETEPVERRDWEESSRRTVYTDAMLAFYSKQKNCPNNGTEKGADMRSAPKSFYNSKQWKDVEKLYKQKQHHLCEKCMEEGRFTPGEIVHHKIHLSEANYRDPEISLNFENLMLLCIPCHNNIHYKKSAPKRWKFVDGELVTLPDDQEPTQPPYPH